MERRIESNYQRSFDVAINDALSVLRFWGVLNTAQLKRKARLSNYHIKVLHSMDNIATKWVGNSCQFSICDAN